MSDSNNNNNNNDEVFKPQLIPSSLIPAGYPLRQKDDYRQTLLAKQIMAIFDDIKPGEGGGK